MRAVTAARQFLLRYLRMVQAVLVLAVPTVILLSPRGVSGTRMAWLAALFFSAIALDGWVRRRRERIVREGALPQFLKRKLRERYPHLTHKDAELTERGLRQFFLACLRSKGQFVAMPSQAADAMWHEFILHTRAYRDWCGLALGRFLHHTPAEVLGRDPRRNDGLRRAWFWACRDEAIDPRRPTRLPLLFALDSKFAIPGGFSYVPDCGGLRDKDASTQCGTDFGDGSSAAGDADAFGGAEGHGGADGHGGDGGCGGDGGGGGGGCGGD